ILRSLPPRWRPKVTAFQEAKVLKDVTLENLISSLRSHEMELQADEPVKKMKSIALRSTKSSLKSLKTKEVEFEEEGIAEDKSDEEMTGHFIAGYPEFSSKDKEKKNNSKKENFKSKVKKSLMATWEDLDKMTDGEDDEEANLALMATASSDESSESEAESNSDDSDDNQK
ncbi:serine/threonine protein kinase SRPK1, partial [Trifolium medium]|nr:serine/threonine protein kinase SRPK1 [Trifolium medium]